MQRGRKSSTPGARAFAVAGVAVLLLPGPAPAQDPAESPPQVDIDRLLELPDSVEVGGSVVRRGGATRAEWEARFQKAREELAAAEAALEETRSELQEVAGENGPWKLTAPGGFSADPASSDAPLDYSLAQQLRRRREAVERGERRLQELRVEANLAGVPAAWQGPDAVRTSDAPPPGP